MVVLASILVVGIIVTYLLQVLAFGKTPFLVLPQGADGQNVDISPGALVALVMGFGALGGLVSTLFSLYLSDKKVDDTMWFDPRPTPAGVKTVMGAWTAFLGVLMVGTGLVGALHLSPFDHHPRVPLRVRAAGGHRRTARSTRRQPDQGAGHLSRTASDTGGRPDVNAKSHRQLRDVNSELTVNVSRRTAAGHGARR